MKQMLGNKFTFVFLDKSDMIASHQQSRTELFLLKVGCILCMYVNIIFLPKFLSLTTVQSDNTQFFPIDVEPSCADILVRPAFVIIQLQRPLQYMKGELLQNGV